MTSELFNRLKKLAKREGKVVFADDKDIFIILPLDEYEMLTDDFCEEECDCGNEECGCGNDYDLGEEVFTDSDKPGEEGADTDKDLIKRVNEDIAKWREEQANHESIPLRQGSAGQVKILEHKNIKTPLRPEGFAGQAEEREKVEEAVKPEAKDDVLTEEERYYLEPLE